MYIYFNVGALCRKAVELKEGCRVVHNPLNFCPIAVMENFHFWRGRPMGCCIGPHIFLGWTICVREG